MEAVLDQSRPIIGARGLNLELRKEGPLFVNGDMDRLIRLFSNLLDNAVRYTPDEGRVRIEIAKQDNKAQVRIDNTGPGIPEQELPRVFDRFYRVASDRSRATGGAGLGLAIAREIALAHGGTIEAKSEPGEGAEFIVKLPSASSSLLGHHSNL